MQLPQQTVRSRPIEQILDGLLGLLCGAKTIAQRHGTMRVDPAVQRAVGRTGCAAQSPLARTRQASTAAPVAHLSRVAWDDLQRSGQTPHPRYAERLVWGDVDVTPRPMGAQAAGSARPWMGRNRSKTGRNTLRGTARDDRAMLSETVRRGTASAVPVLKTALSELATRRGWRRERRQRLGLRLDGGFGTTEGRHGLLRRGYQVVGKIRHRGRGPQWRPALGPWQPPSSPGRELAAV